MLVKYEVSFMYLILSCIDSIVLEALCIQDASTLHPNQLILAGSI